MRRSETEEDFESHGRDDSYRRRASRLAVIQSELVMAEIRRIQPAVKLELVTMKTTGDKILNKTLDKIGGKGLFLKELDAALLENRWTFVSIV